MSLGLLSSGYGRTVPVPGGLDRMLRRREPRDCSL